MSQSKIVLLNSPKSLGKDTAIYYLRSLGYPLVRREAKGKLHELTMAFFCVDPERYWEIYAARVLKETPLEEFEIILEDYEIKVMERSFGEVHIDRFQEHLPHLAVCWFSLRQAMIYISEVVMKPKFSNNYFGVARAKAIQDGEIAVDSSTGFVEELPPLIDRLGQENILLIRVHRQGATFEGDSRSYIPDGVITNTVDVESVIGYLPQYLQDVESVVNKFLFK